MDNFVWTDNLVMQYELFCESRRKEVMRDRHNNMDDFKKLHLEPSFNWVVFTKDGFGFETWRAIRWHNSVKKSQTNWDETVFLFDICLEAERYIVNNKPCLSWQEVVNISKWHSGDKTSEHREFGTINLREIVKKKLNING